MDKIKNIKAAKALVKKYNSITVEDILSFELTDEPFERTDEPFRGRIPMGKLTGFGNTHTCTLCQTVNNICDNCIYVNMTGEPCDTGTNRLTYAPISWAMNPTKLIEAIHNRAKYIESLLTKLSTND